MSESLPGPAWPIQEPPVRVEVRPPQTTEAARLVQRIRAGQVGGEREQRAAMAHPDEAVGCAALDRFGTALLDRYRGSDPMTERARTTVEAIFDQAYEEAKREGLLWTPRIDRTFESMAPFMNILKRQDGLYTRPLRRWIAEQDDPALLEDLWDRTTGTRLRSAIIASATAISPALLERATTANELAAWADNPALGEALVETLVQRMVDHLEVGSARKTFAPGGSYQWALVRQIRADRVSPDAIASVLDQVVSGRVTSSMIVRSLLEDADLDAAQLSALFERALAAAPEALASHPHLTAEQALAIWEHTSTAKVGVRLATNEAVREDPALRDALLSSRSLKTHDALFEHARDPARFPHAFRAYFERRGAQALERLLRDDAPPALLDSLSPADLEPMLTDERRQVRSAAIQLLSRIRGPEAGNEREGRLR